MDLTETRHTNSGTVPYKYMTSINPWILDLNCLIKCSNLTAVNSAHRSVITSSLSSALFFTWDELYLLLSLVLLTFFFSFLKSFFIVLGCHKEGLMLHAHPSVIIWGTVVCGLISSIVLSFKKYLSIKYMQGKSFGTNIMSWFIFTTMKLAGKNMRENNLLSW